MLLFDGDPVPPLPPGFEYPPIGRYEAWFDLVMAFWIFFLILLMVIPKQWGNAVLKVVFPFSPPKDEANS